ncbi:MAG: hypothetical protein CM15mP110_3370 [Alphaproteobacteria bacterium]|nr:MAG: hypothetical protein CM15mP110_3370 [Alphaproteobacteria bacterium]
MAEAAENNEEQQDEYSRLTGTKMRNFDDVAWRGRSFRNSSKSGT